VYTTTREGEMDEARAWIEVDLRERRERCEREAVISWDI